MLPQTRQKPAKPANESGGGVAKYPNLGSINPKLLRPAAFPREEAMSHRSLSEHGLVPPKLQRRRKWDKIGTMGTSPLSNRVIPMGVPVPSGMLMAGLKT